MLSENNIELSLKLFGKSTVDAEHLSSIILNMSQIIKIVSSEDADATIVTIKAFNKGSFETFFSILTPLAMYTLSTFTDIITIFEYFKNKSNYHTPSNTTNISNEYNNCQVNVYNLTNSIYQNNPNEGFQLSDSNKTHTFNNEDVKHIVNNSKPGDVTKSSTLQQVNTTLTILNADIDKVNIWKFNYNGKSISATICDEKFKNIIKNGKPINHDAFINAILEISTETEEYINETKIKKSYRILEVLGDITYPNNNQINLF